MTYKVVPHTDRAEWLQLRQSGVGASDIAGIIGISPWTTPLQLWMQKSTADAPEAETSEQMEWGTRLEDAIIDGWLARHDEATITHRAPLVRHVGEPWMLATPDAVARVDGVDLVVEAKNSSDWSWEEPPDHYVCQVRWQLAVTGIDLGLIVVLHQGNRLSEYEVGRDLEAEAALVEAGRQFWQQVQEGTPPDPLAEDNPVLASLWPTHVERAVEVDAELVAELAEAREAHKAATARRDLVEAQLKSVMGEADTAVVDGRVLATWRTQTASRVDVRRLRQERPDVADEYTNETASRVLRVKG